MVSVGRGVAALAAVVLATLCVGGASAHAVGILYHAPAADDGSLYVSGTDGVVYALESGGEPAWTRQTRMELTTPVTATDGQLYVGGEAGVVRLTTGGDTDWRVAVGDGRITSLAVGEQSVYVTNGTTLFALDPANGTVRWRDTLQGTISTRVVTTAAGPAVAWSRPRRTSTVAAFATDGDRRWTRTYQGETRVLSAGPDGGLYHVANDTLSATAVDGRSRWTVPVETPVGPPAVSGDRVAVGSVDGTLTVVESGRVAWRVERELGSVPAFGPDGERVYAVTARSVLAAADGRILWEREVGATMLEPPSVGDTIRVGTVMNHTYALAPNGSLAWVDRYTTTAADVSWIDSGIDPAYPDPSGNVTRAIRPDGTLVDVDGGATTDAWLSRTAQSAGLAAAVVFLIAAVVLVVSRWRD